MRLVSKAFILLQINDSAASVSRRTQGLAMENTAGDERVPSLTWLGGGHRRRYESETYNVRDDMSYLYSKESRH